jgi:hypothetical protein
MSTRAVYTFQDDGEGLHESYHVYKHHDGYPEGAAKWIEKALDHAWPLPRFEADDFAAAFVAANKPSKAQVIAESPYFAEPENQKYAPQGGGVRLMLAGGPEIFPGDIEYHYVIRFDKPSGALEVQAFEASHPGGWDAPLEFTEIFTGTLSEFKQFKPQNLPQDVL